MSDALCDLVPDCGQPQWPGWRWLILLALVLQLGLSAQVALGAEAEQLRTPRLRDGRPSSTSAARSPAFDGRSLDHE